MTISRILLCSSCGSSMKSHKCFILTQYHVSECSWKNYLIYPAAAAAKSLQSYPTLWPHRWQPTRFPRPWDSPGKNTGVGCHFLLQCMKVKSEKWSCSVVSDSQWLRDCSPPGSSVHGIFQARVLKWVATAFWTKPMSHNYWSPWALEPMLCNTGSHWNADRE